jgi:predicted nucleic-acid-binding Zn-ribbon protein
MKRLSFLFPVLILIYYSLHLVSCTPAACFEETNAYLKASFYINSTKQKLAPDSVTLSGLGQTNKIYEKATGLQPALFPLNASSASSTFIIRINGINDTIEFNHSSFPHLISKECGYSVYYTLDIHAFSQNNIDTILMINRNITTVNEENIRIFY